MADSFWEKGVRFECQGSGKCCTSRGSYGYVYLNLADRKRMAAHLKMKLAAFTKAHCEHEDGHYFLKDPSKDCEFLEGKRCSVYEGRPMQCRTWPFWPENMNAKTWTKEIATFCPGVGKGPVVSASEIRKQLAQRKG